MRKHLLSAVAGFALLVFGASANATTPTVQSSQFNFGGTCPAAGFITADNAPSLTGTIISATVTLWDVPAHRSQVKFTAENGSTDTLLAAVATGEASAHSDFGFPGFSAGAVYPPLGIPLLVSTNLHVLEICTPNDLVSGTAFINYLN